MRSRTETVLGTPKKASACCCQAMHGMQHVVHKNSIMAERTCFGHPVRSRCDSQRQLTDAKKAARPCWAPCSRRSVSVT